MEDNRTPQTSAPSIPELDNLYADRDLESLPGWWRRAIQEHRDHNLRPYRPPRFEDGAPKYRVIDGLERITGHSIEFIGIDAQEDDDWTVRLDSEEVGKIGHHRAPGGYSVFEMESDEFVIWILDTLGNA